MTKKILLLLAILPSILFAQHTIKGKVTPIHKIKFAFLYKVTQETSMFISNGKINEEDGSFEIKIDSAAVAGTYRIVYAQPQEEHNFDLIYNAKEDIELEYDLEKGLNFIASKENVLYQSYNESIDLVNSNIRAYYSEDQKKEKQFKKLISVLNETQIEFEKASEGMIAQNFIKASRPYIPEEIKDVEAFSKGLKTQYFENIDFSNTILQNSDFLIRNTLGYVFGFIDERDINQSYINNVDDAVKAMDNAPLKTKKTLLEIVWNQFAEKGNEPVSNYIAENYLLELANNAKDYELGNNIRYFKNASIGQTGYNFKMEVKGEKDKIELKYLSELETSNNYLIFFWSTTCSHCLDEIPLLKEYVKTVDEKDLKVIAVALDNDYYRWSDMRYEYPDFNHVFGEGKWDNEIGNNYNVKGTPSYFVLDKNKKIIAKPNDFKKFKTYFDALPKEKLEGKEVEEEIMIEKKVGDNILEKK